jgi:hypothetical protein
MADGCGAGVGGGDGGPRSGRIGRLWFGLRRFGEHRLGRSLEHRLGRHLEHRLGHGLRLSGLGVVKSILHDAQFLGRQHHFGCEFVRDRPEHCGPRVRRTSGGGIGRLCVGAVTRQ